MSIVVAKRKSLQLHHFFVSLCIIQSAKFRQPPALVEPPPTEPDLVTKFVPYTSVLSLMRKPAAAEPKEHADTIINYEKKKNNKTTKFAAKKCLNPLNVKARVLKGKTEMLEKIQIKKEKSSNVQKKMQSRANQPSIEIMDSEESSDCCMPVEIGPTPVIELDDSSDEDIAKKKRSHSPSNSSIISDDFIVSSDKKRANTAFRENEMKNASEKLEKILKNNKKQKNIKELLANVKQILSTPTAASSSARSILGSLGTVKSSKTNEKPRKDTQPTTNNEEESVYDAKLKKPKTTQPNANESSDDESPCVNITNVKSRRKSTSSAHKSTEPDSDDETAESQAIVKVKKRSRLITPRYNDDEFASMISTIVTKGAIIEEESEESSVERAAVESQEDDCKIVEPSTDVIEIGDEEDTSKKTSNEEWNENLKYEPISDSDNDSIHEVSVPVDIDLSLNIHSNFEPHELIRNSSETQQISQSMAIASVDPEVGWNDEMKYFYDGSWGGETFSLSEKLNSMSRNPNDWRVSSADRNRSSMNNDKSVRCRNCNEFGHIAVRCTRPKKRIVCYMCGEEGHRETRCPNAICLRCAKPSKTFATVCANCHKQSRRNCPLCGYMGHDIDSCPDKWRRYHSTTTESGDLVREFEVNPRPYCSICARRGHFAESCNQFLKTINGLITSSTYRIMSHKPSYPRNHVSFERQSRPERQVLALFSYFENYKFNFGFDERAQIYHRFMQHFNKYKQVQSNAIASSTTQQETRKNAKRKRKPVKDRDDRQNIIAISQEETQPSPCSDSNYSFSEFYEDKNSSQEQQRQAPPTPQPVPAPQPEPEPQQKPSQLVKNPFAAPLPDFIPLTQADPNVKKPKRTVEIVHDEEISTARMMLTKEHFSLLNNEKGQQFLIEAQARHNVTASFNWSSTGNSISITGNTSSQSLFHAEVREHIYRLEMERYQKLMESSAQLPKSKVNLVRQLKENLQSVNKLSVKDAKRTLTTMLGAEQSLDHKRALKCRRILNIAFVGCALLCEGADHLAQLNRILLTLEEDLSHGNHEVNNEIREEIRRHMRPIFGTVDHGDYRKMFTAFRNVKQKNSKLLPNPIAMK